MLPLLTFSSTDRIAPSVSPDALARRAPSSRASAIALGTERAYALSTARLIAAFLLRLVGFTLAWPVPSAVIVWSAAATAGAVKAKAANRTAIAKGLMRALPTITPRRTRKRGLGLPVQHEDLERAIRVEDDLAVVGQHLAAREALDRLVGGLLHDL